MTATPQNQTISIGGPYTTFTFTVTDNNGPSNVYWVQPHLTWVAPQTFFGSQTQPIAFGCHIIYYPNSNTLYLDSEAGDSSFPQHGSVNGAGSPISNSVCTVDLQNSTVVPQPATSTLQLNLMMKFNTGFPTPTQYTYLSSANNSFTLNPSWYLGWWWMAQNTVY